jgi:hypothetical protein
MSIVNIYLATFEEMLRDKEEISKNAACCACFDRRKKASQNPKIQRFLPSFFI